jgi:hypothetical protein
MSYFYEKFLKDLSQYQNGEIIVYNHMVHLSKGKLNITNVHYNDNYKYDLRVEIDYNEKRYYEVKTDTYVTPTTPIKNITVEVESYSKPSGIHTSIASTYIYYLPHCNQIVYIPKEKLLEAITDPSLRKIYMGDRNANKCVLLPLAKAMEIGRSYILTPTFFKNNQEIIGKIIK